MLVSAVEGHRRWAASYDAEANPLIALEDRVLPEMLGSPVGRVVDVACGTGRWTARLGGVGIDLCEEMLAQAARKPGLAGRVLLADAGMLPLASAVADLALCSLAVGYFPSLDRALGELARITRPGGRVAISDLHPARVAAGATRSFDVDGRACEMRHFGYSAGDLLRAASRAGLELASQRDAFFDAAGAPFPHVPALWMAAWRKP